MSHQLECRILAALRKGSEQPIVYGKIQVKSELRILQAESQRVSDGIVGRIAGRQCLYYDDEQGD